MPYEVYQLEPIGAVPVLGGRGDPIALYGRRGAEIITRRISRLPVDERAVALEVALKAIEPTLPGRVERKERLLMGRGVAPDSASHRAIAAALSEGMLRELVSMGRGKAPRTGSLLGISAYEALGVEVRDHRKEQADRKAAQRKAAQYKYGRGTDADPWRFSPAMIEGTVRDHRMMDLAPFKKAWKDAAVRYGNLPFGAGPLIVAALKQGKVPFTTFTVAQSTTVQGRPITKGQKYGVYFNERYKTMAIRKIPPRKRGLLAKIGGALKSLGKGIIALPKKIVEIGIEAAERLYEFGKDLVEKLADAACDVVNHPAAPAAPGGGAMAYGAPPQAGTMGVEVAKGICNGDDVPGVPPDELATPAGAMPGWVLPVGIGTGVLVLVLALRRRR